MSKFFGINIANIRQKAQPFIYKIAELDIVLHIYLSWNGKFLK